MTEDLDAHLIQLGEDLRRRDKLTRRLQDTELLLRRKERDLARLGEELEAEADDVRKLEGLGLTALFHAILGDKKEKLSKEREEFLASKLAYDECLQSTAALEQDLAATRQDLATFGNLDTRRERLLALKEELLRARGGTVAQQLTGCSEKIAQVRADRTEFEQAANAAEHAHLALEDVANALSNARGWGGLDLAGGGILSTAIKHSHVDGAHNAARRAQTHLDRLALELHDVARRETFVVLDGGFTKFADYFFDGLIFDWIAQSKIVQSLNKVDETRGRVREVLIQLERWRTESDRALVDLERQRRELLES